MSLELDSTAPTFQSAATSTDGSTVTLTYNEALSSTTAATTDFAVTTAGSTNTVTAVSTSGSNVELTLTTPVFKDQSVTVAYTDPNTGSNDANAVQDSTGNDAASLSATTVTNNSTYVQGLQVELFEGINFDGLIQRQQEETIDLYDSYITNAGGDGETWSMRAYGEIQALTTGTNTWKTRSDDRIRIWINGELAQNWTTDHSSQWGDVTADDLVAGQWYSIKIEFAENTEVSRLKLAHDRDGRPFVDELRFNTKAPIFQSAATSADGTKVVLTYDEALSYEEASNWVDAPNTGTSSTTAAPSSFVVTTDGSANAVTAVAVDNETASVSLTLTNPIKNDQTVTVSYTDPNLGSSLGNNDVNAIQGIQGNDAASIANKAVTNNSNVAGTPPLITGPSGSAGDTTSSKSIAENTTAVSQLTANETVTWSLNGGADAAKFQIDSNGNLSFQAAPDFENPNDIGDTANNNTYVVTVRATDTAGNTADQTVTTTVTDVDENSPLITGPSGSAGDTTSSKSIAENTTAVSQLTANETVTWSLNGGADAAKFQIDSNGNLSFQAAPDFENPNDIGDTANNNTYVVTVRATDTAGNTADQTVTTTVTDVDENSPLITGPSGSAGDTTSSKSIAENTTAVSQLTANETVTWSLNGGADAAKFQIDSNGNLSFQAAPDFENPNDIGDTANNNTYVVTVRATDTAGNTADQTVTTTVTDVDENSPLITGPSGSAGDTTSSKSIAENTTAVSQLTANETVTWSLNGGADAAKFQIDSNGNLSFQAAPDFENPNDIGDTANNNTYVVTVRATDTAGNTADQTVTTTVTDVDDSGITIAKTGTTRGTDLLTTEAGGSSTFTVVLDNKPTEDVTVSITGNDVTENSLSTGTVIFSSTNWSTPQTVTVTGVNDDVDDGDITTTLIATANNAGGYAGTETSTIRVQNTDDDTNGVTIAKTGTTDDSGNLLTSEAGSTSTFTVVLDAEPTADVTVTTTGNDATENFLSTDALTFTAANWNTAQTVTITGVDDDIVDGDITTTLTTTGSNTGNYAGTETSTVTVKNIDNDNSGPSPTPTPTPVPTPTPTPVPTPTPTPVPTPTPTPVPTPTPTPVPTTGASDQATTNPPNLIATIDGNGLTISGDESTGTWVSLQTNYSNADLQNSLQIISSKRGQIGSIGAISKGNILGKTEIYLEQGETLSFAQQSSNNSIVNTPNIQLAEQNGSWQLVLEDSNSNTDNDFNDLGITISTHNECQSPGDYQIAQQQKQITDGLFDLSNINRDSLELQITVNSSSDFSNRLAFVRLDDNANNLSLNGISASDTTAFKDAITGALIDPASQRVELQGESSQTITWNLNEAEFGLYAAVVITEENEIITIGSSGFQNGSPLLKSIEHDHIGIKDNPNFSNIDFDYNDRTFQVNVLQRRQLP